MTNLTQVSKAPFIKPRNENTQVFILEFIQHMPRSVYIPGERKDTPIYKMRNKPMMCTKCLHYGHPRKYCRAEEVSCRRCAESGHTTENCAAESPKCLHCAGAHQAGHKDCERQQKEEQLTEIQHNLKVTLRRARQIVENNNEFTHRSYY